MIGERSGPVPVAFEIVNNEFFLFPHGVFREVNQLTAIKTAMARPLVTGSL